MEGKEYDTWEGIERNVATLEGLHNVLQARREAVANSQGPLNRFVVLGKFRLDEFGQVMNRIGTLPPELRFPPVVNEALYQSELQKWIERTGADGFSHGWGIGGNRCLAPAHIPCAMCKQSWTVQNCDDCVTDNVDLLYPLRNFVGQTVEQVFAVWACRTDALYTSRAPAIRNDRFIDLRPSEGPVKDSPRNQNGWMSLKDIGGNAYVVKPGDEIDVRRTRFYHGACRKHSLALLIESAFTRMFEEAGFRHLSLWEIPNQYGSGEYLGPWYEVVTNLGMFKVGWRKRVINIDWSMTGKDFLPVLKGFTTTMGPGYIHAWGYVQGVGILKKICKKIMEDRQQTPVPA